MVGKAKVHPYHPVGQHDAFRVTLPSNVATITPFGSPCRPFGPTLRSFGHAGGRSCVSHTFLTFLTFSATRRNVRNVRNVRLTPMWANMTRRRVNLPPRGRTRRPKGAFCERGDPSCWRGDPSCWRGDPSGPETDFRGFRLYGKRLELENAFYNSNLFP